MKENVETAFEFVREKLFSEKTNIIYDSIVNGKEGDFPTPDEIGRIFPNPCGYSTGMEDGMINGATMLDACLLKIEKENDETAVEFARKIVNGQLMCAMSAKSEGFLPRAVAIDDGKSHYPDSSRDQYTMFAFGMHRYLNSGVCTDTERQKIARIAVNIACRAERNVTAANAYDMLTDNGKPTLVTIMWGDSLGNHEYMRLPMLYLLAYEACKDEYWLEKYREIRTEAYEKSLPMTSYWALYTLQQMQASIRLCYDIEFEKEWREKYLTLMNIVAEYCESLVDKTRERINNCQNFNMPQRSFRELEMIPAERFAKFGYENALSPLRADLGDFFAIQDVAQIAIISGLVPDKKTNIKTEELFADTFAKLDLNIHERCLPVFFIDGYYRSII